MHMVLIRKFIFLGLTQSVFPKWDLMFKKSHLVLNWTIVLRRCTSEYITKYILHRISMCQKDPISEVPINEFICIATVT